MLSEHYIMKIDIQSYVKNIMVSLGNLTIVLLEFANQNTNLCIHNLLCICGMRDSDLGALGKGGRCRSFRSYTLWVNVTLLRRRHRDCLFRLVAVPGHHVVT